MKIWSLILVILIAFAGCATIDHSVFIDTDKLDGYASGQYKDSRSGQLGSWGFIGIAGFSGDTTAIPFWAPFQVRQADSDPTKFAKSIAMINYSKKLKSIKYDETGGIIEYQFEHKPLPYKGSVSQSPSPPPSFGHQPIE